MREKMRNPSHNLPEPSKFSIFSLAAAKAAGLGMAEAAAIAGCSQETAEAVASSDAFKSLLAQYGTD